MSHLQSIVDMFQLAVVCSGRLCVYSAVQVSLTLRGRIHTDCADTSIIRTPSRQELLYTRSRIVIAAKTYGLEAIDMVRPGYRIVIIIFTPGVRFV